MSIENRWLALALFCMAVLLLLLSQVDLSKAHDHPAGDAEIHRKFYNTWEMPDRPGVSCCHEKDCYPTEARKIGGRWEAKRREDGQWLVVPPEKIEHNRDNPDGRNHLCAPPPSYGAAVYCFILGVAI